MVLKSLSAELIELLYSDYGLKVTAAVRPLGENWRGEIQRHSTRQRLKAVQPNLSGRTRWFWWSEWLSMKVSCWFRPLLNPTTDFKSAQIMYHIKKPGHIHILCQTNKMPFNWDQKLWSYIVLLIFFYGFFIDGTTADYFNVDFAIMMMHSDRNTKKYLLNPIDLDPPLR